MSSFLWFLLGLNLLLGAINYRAYSWLARSFQLRPAWRRLVATVFAGSLLLSMGGRVLSRAGYDFGSETLFVAAFSVQLAILIGVVLLLPLDVYRLVRRLLRLGAGASKPLTGGGDEAVAEALPDSAADDGSPALATKPTLTGVSRRQFATQVAVGSSFLIGTSNALYGALVGRHDYVIEEVPVRVDGLSKALDGFTIVQLSDLHIGQFVGRAELAAAETLVRQARPDLIVLTGDLIDNDPHFAPTLGRFVRRLAPLAREGVAMVTGNHDFYAGVTPIVNTVKQGGAKVLRNRGVVVGDGQNGFALLGVDDVRARRFQRGEGPSLDLSLRSLASTGVARALDLPRILLCHNPEYFAKVQDRVALQLSGHTHGGQVNLGVRPADLFLPHGWIAGMYQESGANLYVNRGFGTAGPPVRVGAPPEVSRIVLVAG